MPRLIYAQAARDKVAHVWRFYHARDPRIASRAVAAITNALRGLESNQSIGRPFQGDLHIRELVIPFGGQGFLALYRLDEDGTIVVLTLRHQREKDYPS